MYHDLSLSLLFSPATVSAPQPGGGADAGLGVALMIVGMGVVFAALIAIWFTVALIRKFGEDRPGKTPAVESAPSPATPEVDNAHLVAVLSAAAVAAVGRPVRVRQVVLLGRSGNEAWSSDGRVTIMGAHRLQTSFGAPRRTR